MKIIPIRDNVLIEVTKKSNKTDSGILLPSDNQEKQEQGRVIAVGPGIKVDGAIESLEVNAGDTVIFTQYGPSEIKVNGEKYLIAKESDILAIIKN